MSILSHRTAIFSLLRIFESHKNLFTFDHEILYLTRYSSGYLPFFDFLWCVNTTSDEKEGSLFTDLSLQARFYSIDTPVRNPLDHGEIHRNFLRPSEDLMLYGGRTTAENY